MRQLWGFACADYGNPSNGGRTPVVAAKGPTIGVADPWPTTTLIEPLRRIRKKGAPPPGLDDLLKQAINNGLKNFRDDKFFNRALRKYLESGNSQDRLRIQWRRRLRVGIDLYSHSERHLPGL